MVNSTYRLKEMKFLNDIFSLGGMMSIIKHLKIENEDYAFIDNTNEGMIENLSKVNIFVGANNSGKSRFMRSLFYVDDNYKLKFIPNSQQFDYFIKQSSKFKDTFNNRMDNIISSNERQANININKHLFDFDYLEESKINFFDLINLYNEANNKENTNPMTYEGECNKIFKNFFDEIEFNDNLFKFDFYKIYIPSLRGLIPIFPKDYQSEEIDLYGERVKQDYFGEKSRILTDVGDFLNNDLEYENSKNEPLDLKEVITRSNKFPKHSIITGMRFYNYVKNYLLGDFKQREIIREYEEYLSETFFNNEKVVLIPKIKDDVLTIKIGNEEYKIYDVGEGIQSIILITLPLFLYLEKSKENNTNILVFIEEPEIGLHPGLQQILIKTFLNDRFENFQFFFTTHSNHFVDQTLVDNDISIYLFDKKFRKEKFEKEFNINKIDKKYWDIMEEMGVLPSSTLMSNCTILVEGVTDRNHFQLYLELYQNQLAEDEPKYKNSVHYTFLIAGGSEYTNTIKSFNEIQKEKLCFICDYDNDQKEEERKRFFEKYPLKNQHTLGVTEVENLISKSVIISTLKNTYRISEDDLNTEFNEEDYIKSNNFYEFIVNEVIECDLPEKFPKGKDKLKNPLCRNEKKNLKEYDELTQEAKDIAKYIYEFIKKNN